MSRFLSNLKELYRYRVLIQNLVVRELKARYRGTVLGFLWSFVNPLLLMIVYSVVFGFIIRPRDPAFDNNPIIYALYLFCGILPWTWFSSSSVESANILMIQGNLIKKVLFPAEILPVVVVTSNFINFLLSACPSWSLPRPPSRSSSPTRPASRRTSCNCPSLSSSSTSSPSGSGSCCRP